jgi:threonine/homoserine/homoserine lactone efflux protein
VQRWTEAFSALLEGLAIGLAMAAPLGPIGLLCIRRTLAEGRLSGLVSGLGAATADAFYGSVAGFSLTGISGLLVGQLVWLRMIGGAFLICLGVRIFTVKPATEAASAAFRSLGSAYASTLALTLTNPLTILSFAAIFAGLGVAGPHRGFAQAGLLVLGVFLGSATWWWILSGVVALFRSRLDLHRMRWINRLSGVAIAGFGVLALVSVWGAIR